MVELIRRHGIKQQLIVCGRARGLERLFPTLTWGPVRGDHQAIVFNAELDSVTEAALLNNRLGDSYTARVANTHQFYSHLVITL